AVTRVARTENNGSSCGDGQGCSASVCDDGECIPDPNTQVSCKVTPVLTCVAQKSPTVYTAYFGYNTASQENVHVPPLYPENYVTADGAFTPIQDQPGWFLGANGPDGMHHAVFAEDFTTSSTWVLGSNFVSATPGNTCLHDPSCPNPTDIVASD